MNRRAKACRFFIYEGRFMYMKAVFLYMKDIAEFFRQNKD